MLVAGWRRREWLMLACCVRCRRIAGAGVTHVHDQADPPDRFLCDTCYALIMATPERPAEPTPIPSSN